MFLPDNGKYAAILPEPGARRVKGSSNPAGRYAQGDGVLNSAFRPANLAGIAEFLNGKGRK
jgi:hypothetical protein